MYRLSTIILIFLCLCFIGPEISAQEELEEESFEAYNVWIGEANLAIFNPINNFGKQVSGTKIGFQLQIMRQANPESPIFIGLGSYYTRIARNVQENVTNLGEDVDDIANSNMLGFDAVFRYYPNMNISVFEPYVEANLGVRSFYTVTKSYFPEFDETTDFSFNEFNGALSYGFALGTQAFVNPDVALNFRFNFQLANIARYYVEGENSISSDPLDSMTLENSQTDLLRFDIGISYVY